MSWDQQGGGLPGRANVTSGPGYIAIAAANVNDDFAIVPNGTGSFQLQIADNTAIGGNVRGSNAVDLQMVRSAATQVANGVKAFVAGENNTVNGTVAAAIGSGNTASGTTAIVLGYLSTASALAAVAFGESNTASGAHSIALGLRSVAAAQGELAQANGMFAANGDAQVGAVVLRQNVTDATPTILTLDGLADASTNRFFVANNTIYEFEIRVQAAQTGGAAGTRGDNRRFKISGAIAQIGGVTALQGALIVVPADGAPVLPWTVVVTAGTGYPIITFTGEANKNVRIVANLLYTKVGF